MLVKFKQRTTLAQDVKTALEKISEQMKTKVFKTTIRESVKAQQAQATRTTLIKFAPTSTTATDYKDLVKELGIK